MNFDKVVGQSSFHKLWVSQKSASAMESKNENVTQMDADAPYKVVLGETSVQPAEGSFSRTEKSKTSVVQVQVIDMIDTKSRENFTEEDNRESKD